MAELQYKCPCCGGDVEFNAGVQKMKCPYCDTEFDVDAFKDFNNTVNSKEQDSMNWQSSAETWQAGETAGMRVYVCKSCGGEVVGDENMGATSCPYCDSPIVMSGQFSGTIKPSKIIPFKLDKEAAKQKYLEYVTGKKLLPKTFKERNHIDEMKGIYVPFWLFDAKTDGRFYYKATKVREWEDEDFEYKETSYFNVYRAGKLAFQHVPVDSAEKLDDKLTESVEPFNYSDAVEFQPAYLSGYMADKYDQEASVREGRANERIKNSTAEEFRNTVKGFDTVTTEHASVQLSDGKSEYVMYPMWLLNTTWNGQKYTFAMNGETGKFVGNLPCDKAAFTKLFLGSGAIASVIVFIIAYIIQFMG